MQGVKEFLLEYVVRYMVRYRVECRAARNYLQGHGGQAVCHAYLMYEEEGASI